MNIKELDVTALALSLYDGESKAGQTCPFCNGGTSGDKSFYIARDNNYAFYRCYRASCGKAGRVRVSGSVELREERAKQRVFETDPDPPSPETSAWVRERYNLNDDEYNRGQFGWTVRYGDRGRLYVPMLRRNATVRGYVARDLTGEQKPKVLNFKWRSEEPSLHWYNNPRSKKLVLVEDMFSALRCSSYLTSAALTGTELTAEGVDEVRREGFLEAFLALDKDATNKAVKLALRYRGKLPLTVVPLPKDLKDMGREELEQFLKENLDV